VRLAPRSTSRMRGVRGSTETRTRVLRAHDPPRCRLERPCAGSHQGECGPADPAVAASVEPSSALARLKCMPIRTTRIGARRAGIGAARRTHGSVRIAASAQRCEARPQARRGQGTARLRGTAARHVRKVPGTPALVPGTGRSGVPAPAGGAARRLWCRAPARAARILARCHTM
jgi:hypothetical protein